ncbi:hypothetical protein KXD93_24655 [Mucilaginibacter sp. BJC16-A38]|uniref:hypothetical protein n=1 Tax=Mucilaginibacter phenanthrenivorans TaxID=1234842 RepID=UPI002158754F|nr:hypothetical protein [Mucilaginibacter phenanthrenivorans]MCR8560871.1 hypothetical protein [Mucilaginibacter phenanthrenivorans]
MENEFEKYLHKNRARFEEGSPSPRVWEKLQRNLTEQHARRQRIIRIRRISLGIAAGVLLCIGAMLLLFKNNSRLSRNAITQNTMRRDSTIESQKLLAEKIELDSTERIAGITDNKTRQSLYSYAKRIETRQKQLAVLQQLNPDLYARSQKVLMDLNMGYNQLQKQLPGSLDQQKVLKALIQNLKMQELILNNQLQLLEELQIPDNASDGKKDKKI